MEVKMEIPISVFGEQLQILHSWVQLQIPLLSKYACKLRFIYIYFSTPVPSHL